MHLERRNFVGISQGFYKNQFNFTGKCAGFPRSKLSLNDEGNLRATQVELAADSATYQERLAGVLTAIP